MSVLNITGTDSYEGFMEKNTS